MTKSISTEDYWTSEKILEYWEDPKNRDLIVNAIPLEYLSKKELHSEIISHLEKGQRKSFVCSTDSGAAKQIPDEETPVQAPGDKYCLKSLTTAEPIAKVERRPPRIARATPYIPGNNPPGNSQASQVNFVDFNDLTKFPYQSVGKLFWLTQDGKEIIYYSTAFYIGNGVVVTAAHAFDQDIVQFEGKLVPKPSKAAMFVPAMRDKSDIYGEHYGCYPIVGEPVIHFRYKRQNDPKDVEPFFDLCTFKISDGVERVGRTLQPTSFFLQPHVVQPITACPYTHIEKAPVTVLGYGARPKTILPETIPNINGLMMEFQGNISHVDEYLDKNEWKTRIIMNRDVWYGASGGPWLNTSVRAIGIQSAINKEAANESYSPYFSPELFRLSNNVSS